MMNFAKEKHTVVLIDDDKWLTDLYGEKLQMEGFDVFIANNGKKGLELIMKHKPDIVLSDMVMPGGDGFFVLKKMRANTEMQNIPVVALTNLSSESDKNECLKMGARCYLVKADNTPSQVVNKIREILDNVQDLVLHNAQQQKRIC